MILKCTKRDAENVKKVVIEAFSKLPQAAVNSKEFVVWAEIEKALNCDIYFADAYCAWQKGSNENLNGLLEIFT